MQNHDSSHTGTGLNIDQTKDTQPGRSYKEQKENALQLQSAEKLYQRMVEEVQDYAILILDTEGNILNLNIGVTSIKGYTSDEIINKNFSIFYTAQDRDNRLPETLLEEAARTGRASHEGWRIKKDGGKFWGSVVITALHDEAGNVIGFSKHIHDLSERKANEEKQQRNTRDLEQKNEELRRSEDRYHRMIAEIEDYAIILLDTEGKVLNWNKGAQNIKGYKAEEILGRSFSVFYLQSDIDAGLPKYLINEAATKGKASHEGWRVKKDGTTFWGSIVITALHDDDNNVIGYSKVTRDLTERKKAEERLERYTAELKHHNEMLRRSEERYHRMISEVEDYAIILLDIDGNILNWNKGAENIKGYKESEIMGKNFRSFYLQEDRERLLPEQLLAEAIAHNKAAHEGWRVRKDGSRFWGNVVITALHDEQDNLTGFSKVTRDLTQKKQFEDYILMQNKQLEEYAYVASHDLQEPLRKIMLFSGLLKDSLDDKETSIGFLGKINASAARMGNLIKAVLEYSQANNTVGLHAEVDLNQVVHEIEEDFEILLKEKNVTIDCGALPRINAVPIQMRQLFANLISNAIKFNANHPVITITAEPAEDPIKENGQMTRICIADNGIGLEPEYHERIFRMFHRLHSNKEGTGIGLALCKKIVDNHGGSITVLSSPGNGTRFEIILPVNL
jgi:PAS domain S-box-containing protein